MLDALIFGVGVNLEEVIVLRAGTGQKQDVQSSTLALAGGSFNLAAGLSRLGLSDVHLLAIVGQVSDKWTPLVAPMLAQAAKAERFTSTPVHAKDRTSFATVILRPGQSRELLSDRGKIVDWESVRQQIGRLVESEAAYFRIATSLRPSEYHCAREFFDRSAPGGNRPIRVLGVTKKLLQDEALRADVFRGVHYIFFNEEEYWALRGHDRTGTLPDELDRDTFAAEFARDAMLRGIIVTFGERGAILFSRTSGEPVQRIYQPAITPEHGVVDDTGAGDALCAGFCAALRRGYDPPACLLAGVGSASLAVQRLGGASAPTASELDSLLNDYLERGA